MHTVLSQFFEEIQRNISFFEQSIFASGCYQCEVIKRKLQTPSLGVGNSLVLARKERSYWILARRFLNVPHIIFMMIELNLIAPRVW